MQKYTDVVFSSTGTSAVAPLPLATVTVAYAAGGTPTLYSDNGVTVLSNPFTSDANGRISFYAADGRYTLTVSKTGYATVTISDILLEDPTNPNPISATTLTATGTSTLQGVTATSLAVSGAATVGAGLAVTGALSATGALTTNGLKEDSSGGLGIGGATSGIESLRLVKNMTGAVNSVGVYNVGTVQSDVTNGAWYYRTFAATQAATFTLPQLIHYSTVQGTIGAGSTVTTQIGFEVNGTLIGATNNYGFYGALSYATGRYNLFMAGTADNYLAGNVGIGATPAPGCSLNVTKAITGAAFAAGARVNATVQSDVTSRADNFQSVMAVAAGTYNTVVGYQAQQGTITGTLTNQIGFSADPSLVGATNNYGFYGNIPAGTGRYNFYANGTAPNFFNGQTTITTGAAGATNTLIVIDTGVNGGNIQIKGNGAVTPSKFLRVNSGVLQIINDAYGAVIVAISDTGNLNVVSPTGSLGYGTGAGGTVTQATSKANPITLNTPTGQITLNGSSLAAGATTTFTFNNSLISIKDTIILNMVETFASVNYLFTVGIGTGAATIGIRNMSAGALAEAIVFNFSIIKGASA